MGVYLYCVAGPDHPAPSDVAGLEGRPVRAVPAAGLAAWVSDLDAPPDASLDAVRVHNHVVEAANRAATPLPVRFGQWYGTDDDLIAALAGRADPMRRSLARVSGAVEVGVRILDPRQAADPPDRSTGTAYLEALARRSGLARENRARGERVARELRDRLDALVRDHSVRLLGEAGALVTVAFLVDRHDIGNYERAAREFAGAHSDLRFVFTGPWPPYGFAGDSA